MWSYATYLINATKVWLLCIVHTNISITGNKERFQVQNCPCGMVGANIDNLLVLLVHDKVVIELDRNVSSSIAYYEKNIKYCENKPNRMRSNVLMHTKTPNVTIQWNIPEMRYRNDVIRSVLFLHIRANLGMMLTRNYASCHAARSTLVMLLANNVQKLRWPAKSLDLNPIERKFWAQPLQLNLRELTRVIHQMYSAIPQ